MAVTVAVGVGEETTVTVATEPEPEPEPVPVTVVVVLDLRLYTLLSSPHLLFPLVILSGSNTPESIHIRKTNKKQKTFKP